MLYAATIFLSAFLLFQVQPLIAKKILPWFGGTAAVWLACLLFFQVALLLGYLYAHCIAHRVPPRARRAIHLLLLAAGLLTLPVIPDEAWRPSSGENPLLRVLAVLGGTVGLPYFLLATTTPLLQAWYAERSQLSPYRFFAVSNAGSLLGLLSYPLLLEPLLTSRQQAWTWSAGYTVVTLLYFAVTLRHTGTTPAPGRTEEEISRLGPGVTPTAQFFWLALPAVSAALLFAVTNHITQNIAAVPLLWVVPLALYLLSFVLGFGPVSFYSRRWALQFLAVALGAMAYALHPDMANTNLRLLLAVFCGGLFVACLACHGELARLKPPAGHLTHFYLFVSIGGALGGLYVSGVAPLIHSSYLELPIAVGGCAVIILLTLAFDPESRLHHSRWSFAWIGCIGLAGLLIAALVSNVLEAPQATVQVRNFYGTLRVIDETGSRPFRRLMHGSIDHGLQFTEPSRQGDPTAYYVPNSGVGLALSELQQRGAVRVGVIGLGAGTLAAYARAGDTFRFYEINPAVVRIAQNEFVFLTRAPSKIEIVHGDARLSLEREASLVGEHQFDLLAVDAFSGDAIPAHLLTREAVALYFRCLKPGGVLALHISNKYVDLQPVAESVLRSLGKQAVLIESTAEDGPGVYRAFWVLASDREEFFASAGIAPAAKPLARREGLRPWTDDYSNLIRVLK